ncbi:2965_t:CDS:2 [Entrophospora sp. SA101]|nr:2965_t:CDS:2 [Entrophospora sp. SA101]
MPDSLNRFDKETQEIISQWFNNANNNNNDNPEVEYTYIDTMLLVIEWNDAGLQNRNVQKTNVVATEDIVSELRELYFQRNRASLGRVYEVHATKKGVFEIKEYRKVF